MNVEFVHISVDLAERETAKEVLEEGDIRLASLRATPVTLRDVRSGKAPPFSSVHVIRLDISDRLVRFPCGHKEEHRLARDLFDLRAELFPGRDAARRVPQMQVKEISPPAEERGEVGLGNRTEGDPVARYCGGAQAVKGRVGICGIQEALLAAQRVYCGTQRSQESILAHRGAVFLVRYPAVVRTKGSEDLTISE